MFDVHAAVGSFPTFKEVHAITCYECFSLLQLVYQYALQWSHKEHGLTNKNDAFFLSNRCY